MAKIGALLAEELGADVQIVKQGALLHDIGKALDQDLEGSHVELGVKIAEKFNLDPRIKEAIASHHHDTDVSGKAERATSLEAIIVDVCDNISGSRPGARKDSLKIILNVLRIWKILPTLTKACKVLRHSGRQGTPCVCYP